MKFMNRILIVGAVVFSMGFTSVVKTADEPYGSETEVAERNKPRFVMPQPLSQLIVGPGEMKVPLERDPFEPLPEPPKPAAQVEEEPEDETFAGMQYAGLVQWGEAFSVLLKTENKKGVYQINDRIQEWTIIDINEAIVTFQKGNKTYQLQRGDK